eukprot:UN24528
MYTQEKKGTLQTGWPYIWRQLLSGGLAMIQDNKTHSRVRFVFTPLFSKEAMSHRFDMAKTIIEEFLDTWQKESEKDKTLMLPVFGRAKRLTTKLVTKILFGKLVTDEENDKITEDLMVFLLGFEGVIPFEFYGGPFAKAMKARRSMCATFDNIITRARKEIEQGQETEVTVIHRMLQARDEEGKPMTQKEMVDQLPLLFFAGQDTTAALLCSILKRMNENPEMVEKLESEIKTIEEPATWNKLDNLPYMEAFCKEVLRIDHPVIVPSFRISAKSHKFTPAFDKTKTYDMKEPFGYAVDANAVHFNEEYYPKPEVFDPDRFLRKKCIQVGGYLLEVVYDVVLESRWLSLN